MALFPARDRAGVRCGMFPGTMSGPDNPATSGSPDLPKGAAAGPSGFVSVWLFSGAFSVLAAGPVAAA